MVFVVGLEVTLGELENKYPSIPAIEVTIPHVHASCDSTFLKGKRRSHKKFVVWKAQ
jgi:hypothetical protein